MKIDIKARYPAPTAVVLKMFMDKAFHEKKMGVLGVTKFKVVEHDAKGDEMRIKIERKMPLAPPGMISKFVPADATIVSEERWNKASRTGKVKVEPQGMPIEISANVRFADDAKGCTVTYVFDINAKVPLVGGALEKFVAGDMDKKFGEEAKAAATLLDPYR